MTTAPSMALLARITEYLGNGGLFNPELMNHEAVRDLLLDACAALQGAEQERDELLAALKLYVEWFGAAHVDGCPADDTCFCSGSAVNDAVNKAIAKAEGKA